MNSWMRRRVDERGSVLVVTALAAVAMMGFAALGVDAGRVYSARHRLVDVCDAAAFAAAQNLPEDPATAEDAAWDCLRRNGVDPVTAEVIISQANTKVTVTAGRTVAMSFARVIGLDEAEARAVSSAVVTPAGGFRGAQPFGIESGPFEYGVPYTLKLGSKEPPRPQQGNFHALALGGSGASWYRENIRNGYDGILRVGQLIFTEPGNMTGPTREGLRDRFHRDPYATFETVKSDSPRILLVPLVSTFDVCGRTQIEILGFGAFFLEDQSFTGNIRGRFMRLVRETDIAGDWSADYGVRIVRLVEGR